MLVRMIDGEKYYAMKILDKSKVTLLTLNEFLTPFSGRQVETSRTYAEREKNS